MRNYIPTLKECEDLVKNNECFYSNYQEVNGITVASFTYRYAEYEDFLKPGALNIRGITFNRDTGELLALPFWKFFNYGENPFTDIEKVKDWGIRGITQKLDGSLVYFFMANGKIRAKTKFSCTSPQAELAMKMFTKERGLCDFIMDAVYQGKTPMFELIGPDNQIILNYDKNKLVYIGSRDMKTGKYYNPYDSSISRFVINMHVPIEVCFGNIETIYDYCKESDKMEEGFVAEFKNGELVKFKTRKYFDMHRVVSSVQDERAIAELSLNEQIDDVIVMLPEDFKERVRAISEKVRHTYRDMVVDAELFCSKWKGLLQKEYALKGIEEFGKEDFRFHMCISMRGGKFDEERNKEHFIRNKLWQQ